MTIAIPTPTILFEDGEALVIDKPAGLAIDRPRHGGACLEDHAGALRLGFQRAPVAVHRLDTDTSGCLLLARNPKALSRFSAAFAARLVEKRYLGVLAGGVAEDAGEIDLALGKVSSARTGWRMVAAKNGKPALTRWRKLAESGGLTLIEFRPETGRTHQIRVHAALALGAGLLGDPVYGVRGGGGTLLHAASIRLEREGKPPVSAHAPFPAAFAALGFADPDATDG